MPATKELLQEGRYRINQEFTPNGSDTVYDAYDTVSNSNVVVKEIPVKLNKVATQSQQDALKLAFENQAKILTGMQHDSLLHVRDFFADLESHYLVMEAVEGDDLYELMRRNKSPFGLEDVVKWADQLLDALNYLHTYTPPVIHKNVKPENIKLTSGGQIKLLAVSSPDSSDAKLTTALGPDPNSEEALKYAPIELIWQGLDPASQMAITNGYDERSERILKQPADPRSDIYSLGATLYHLVTASEPINALERSIEVLDGKPDPLKEATKLNPSVPPEISDVLLKAMELKRENRYDSAVIMRQVLKTAVVRLQEQAAEDAKEQNEAADALRLAEQQRAEREATQKRDAEAAEQKLLAAESEQKRVAEEAEKKRVEAETQARAAAERKAAEATEKLRKEEEAAAAKKAADEKAAKEAKEAEARAAREAEVKTKAAAAAEVTAYSAAARTSDAHISDVPFSSGYDEPEVKSGFAMMPLIAAGVGLVVLVVVAFFLLSGGNEVKPTTTALGTTTSGQNAPAASLETAPDPSQVPPAEVQPDPAAVQAAVPDAQAQARAAAAAKDKAKKPTATPAAKPAEAKKSVTVDDIINDN